MNKTSRVSRSILMEPRRLLSVRSTPRRLITDSHEAAGLLTLERVTMRLIDLHATRKLLRRQVDRAGGQVAWAKRHGLHPSTINKVLNEQRLPGRRMLAALHLQKVIAYRRLD